ncbi:MAG: helix-turn-helix domain-containing protein [Treponema sp.]|jgi:transcriptional regulator with XRE-family HTH domain|nr:helix-turn-helix domain-containing protein [Treponema sp.]
MGFRENLKELLEFSGLEQKELAAQTGISLRTIENYLKQATISSIPSADKAVLIAQVLGVSVEYLVTGSEAQREKTIASLRPDIRALLRSIELLDEKDRKLILVLAEGLKERKSKA